MALTIENGVELVQLLKKLASRPKKGELPEEVKERDGMPVVRLVGDDKGEVADEIGSFLSEAQPVGVPHESIDVSVVWEEKEEDQKQLADLAQDGEGWVRAELYRRILVKLAEEFSSARNAPDTRVRFRRLGLVNWLLESTDTREGLDDPHDRRLLRRLRDRELRRRRLWAALRSPDGEVALKNDVPWWGFILGWYLFPVAWFRAWRILGPEYRWLLRQPYMAPRDPGTFVGFALRLAQPRRERENPDQIGKLLINAFLEDLRVEYRRRPWRRRAWRRTVYCVAFVKGASEDNHGNAFVRSLIEVRNEAGVFDPLLIIESIPRTGFRGAQPRSMPLDAYEAWWFWFKEAKRSRQAKDWYLTLDIPKPLPLTDPRCAELIERVERARAFTVPPLPRLARRRVTVVAAVVAVALLCGGGAYALDTRADWRQEHCGLDGFNADAVTVRREPTGECVGIAPYGYAFGVSDDGIQKTLATIARQNGEAERIHRKTPSRPIVTLVHISSLLGRSGLQYARESFQGAASAQRRQLNKQGETDPVVRILPASAGSGMRFGPTVVAMLKQIMRNDRTIIGVTGLDTSRHATITTIHEITRIGLPMVATTPSADILDDQSPLYYQVSPQNNREAAIAAAYAKHLAGRGTIRRKVQVLYSVDPSDEYSKNLRSDADRSFAGAGFSVDDKSYVPSPPPKRISGDGARSVGKAACRYTGVVFFAGRSEDVANVLQGINDVCGTTPPTFLGGDDVARFAADPKQRRAFPEVPFDFLDFTLGTASCDSASNLYSTMKGLFPAECKKVSNSSLDGHASLAFDAVNLYLNAIGQLQDTAPSMPLTAPAVWHGLSSIHGAVAQEGESGKIDFGGRVDQRIPIDKLLSVQHVNGARAPSQVGFCGKRGGLAQSTWCPSGNAS